jgi:2-amino-4-hydroxy-6-hydroxymethyldihydropteridine diphosphokinase
MAPKRQIFIGLGSNISPEQNLKSAAAILRKHFPDIQFSSVYRSKAMEIENQDDFLNAVAIVDTEKSPQEVHTILQEIEQSLGKAPPYRFGPRTIDLDILLYGNGAFTEDGLAIPHKRMHERRFVLEPLCELLDSQAMHPVLSVTWEELLEKTLDQQCALTDIAL